MSMETLPALWDTVSPEFWRYLEICYSIIFTVEYGLRFWSCIVVSTSRWSFFWRPLNLLDVCALVPFYIDIVVDIALSLSDSEDARTMSPSLRILRSFRLFRVARVFKVIRHSTGLQVMLLAVSNSTQALAILLWCFSLCVITFSSLIYYLENMDCANLDDIPLTELGPMLEHMRLGTCENIPRVGWSRYGLCCDAFDAALDFPSIAHAFWWSVVTMTTVGYGDKLARTRQGKVVGTLVILSGIVFIALPTAIVGRKFNEIYTQFNSAEKAKDDTSRKRSGHAKSPRSVMILPREFVIGEKRFVDRTLNTLVKNFSKSVERYKVIDADDARLNILLAARSTDAMNKMQDVAHQHVESLSAPILE